jgi:hypothetical protein
MHGGGGWDVEELSKSRLFFVDRKSNEEGNESSSSRAAFYRSRAKVAVASRHPNSFLLFPF